MMRKGIIIIKKKKNKREETEVRKKDGASEIHNVRTRTISDNVQLGYILAPFGLIGRWQGMGWVLPR